MSIARNPAQPESKRRAVKAAEAEQPRRAKSEVEARKLEPRKLELRKVRRMRRSERILRVGAGRKRRVAQERGA